MSSADFIISTGSPTVNGALSPSAEAAIHWPLFLVGTFPDGMIGGLGLNVLVALCAFALSFLLGHGLAIGRLSRRAAVRWPCAAYIEGVRSVPLLIALFWFYFSIPVLLNTTPSPFWTALIALSGYGAAYQAEYIRAGIQAVPGGEVEAARSLGLSPCAVWLRVVLPQAHRRMVPTYASYFTSMFKDTSVLYFVGLVELMQTGLIAAERQPGRMLQAYLVVAALFFAACWSASRLGRLIERRLAPRTPSATSAHPPPRPANTTGRQPQEKHYAHA